VIERRSDKRTIVGKRRYKEANGFDKMAGVLTGLVSTRKSPIRRTSRSKDEVLTGRDRRVAGDRKKKREPSRRAPRKKGRETDRKRRSKEWAKQEKEKHRVRCWRNRGQSECPSVWRPILRHSKGRTECSNQLVGTEKKNLASDEGKEMDRHKKKRSKKREGSTVSTAWKGDRKREIMPEGGRGKLLFHVRKITRTNVSGQKKGNRTPANALPPNLLKKKVKTRAEWKLGASERAGEAVKVTSQRQTARPSES